MLTITIPATELFDDLKNEFIDRPAIVLELEHSLVSLSKWESKWEKAFLGPVEKTTEETLDYIRMMILSEDVPLDISTRLTPENLQAINKYIEAKMTATTFNDQPGRPNNREIVTAELIYYWMVALTIPFECQHWHLNRLLTLIRVCNVKNSPPKKMGRADMAAQRRALNDARLAKYNTTG